MSEEEKQIHLYMHSKNELGLATLCVEKDKEIEKLNNIINELEKQLLEWHSYWKDEDTYSYEYKTAYDYLQELKEGVNKDEN